MNRKEKKKKYVKFERAADYFELSSAVWYIVSWVGMGEMFFDLNISAEKYRFVSITLCQLKKKSKSDIK